jgi:hypothetical protein
MLVGVAVASATSGSSPPLWPLAVIVAVPVVASFVDRRVIRPRRSARRRYDAAHPATGSQPADERRLTSADWAALGEIASALDDHQLRWLRAAEFTTPWLHDRVRPVLALQEPVAAALATPYPEATSESLVRLGRAVAAFADAYDRDTHPDPLMLGEDWRFFEWDERGAAAGTSSGGEPWAGRSVSLRDLAAEVVDGYDGLAAVASQRPHRRRKAEARA